MKMLLWAAVLLIVVLWLFRSKNVSAGPNAAASARRASEVQGAEQIVQCIHCGVHIPASEAVLSPSGAVFCSQEHRLRHVKS